jgi:serine/threonine protein kinase
VSITGDAPASFAGTELYMAPEVLMRQRPTSAVDIWSFGIIVFEMATRSPPFAGFKRHALIR